MGVVVLVRGNCAAGGGYAPDGSGGSAKGLAVSERNGVWGNAEAVADLAGLNAGKSAIVEFMSCRSAGNCTAAGMYETGDINDHVFVVSEKNGACGTAEPIRGLTAPGVFESSVRALSCGSPGNCTITGNYDGRTGSKAFSAAQKNGLCGAARTFPTLAKGAGVGPLSCWPGGTCTAAALVEDALAARVLIPASTYRTAAESARFPRRHEARAHRTAAAQRTRT